MSEQNLILFSIIVLLLVFSLATYLILKRKSDFKKLSTHPIGDIAAYLPEDKFIDIENHTVRYWDEGSGPVLLLIHGIGASAFIWRFIFKPLSKKYRVIAIDLPGFGKSSKSFKGFHMDHQVPRIIELLDKLHIHELHIIGSSMGGAIALWIGKLYPERVKSIVAMAPATHSSLVKLPVSLLKTFNLSAKALVKKRAVQLNILNKVVVNKKLLTDENLKVYFEPYITDPKSMPCFLDALNLIKDPRLPKQLTQLKPKVLLYYGRHDQLVPKSVMQSLDKLIPHSTLYIDNLSGHHPMEDNPEEVIKQVSEFL